MNGYYVILILLAMVIGGMKYLKKKKGFKVTGPLVLFRTKHGVRIIGKIANACPRFWKGFSTFGVVFCFAAMGYIFYALLKNTLKFFSTPDMAAGAIPVIPGVTIPFWAGVIGLITVLVFHEFSHGIVAIAEKIKVKNVGIASLGFLPIGAFVEPNEKQLKKKKTHSQLRMYAAGSFMNFIIGGLTLVLLLFIILPGMATLSPAAHIVSVDVDSPAELAGLPAEAVLYSIGETQVTGIDEFMSATDNTVPGQNIVLSTDQGDYPVQLGEKAGSSYIGIQAVFCTKNVIHPLCYNTKPWVPNNMFWFTVGALNWIIILNFGIGLFNLLPLKPFDGGLMTEAVTKKIVPKASKFMVRGLSAICILMVVINLVGPYIF
ncbi:MAG: site-2 protease family protein [Candidatus Undinarchaeales archaeon]|jgi:membrane-associated protease RseP (regulator of RpoE activity)|nr:site-2 protease family protein [Candidatus Undinarchaeales archaeon]